MTPLHPSSLVALAHSMSASDCFSRTNTFSCQVYCGGGGHCIADAVCSPLTRYRDMMLDFSMSTDESDDILDSLQEDQPFYCRLDFIKCLAALCQRLPTEVSKKIAGANKHVYKILWAACAPDRFEWLMNSLRVRHQMDPSYRWFLPSGTSSNEALHAEINSWSRSINVMHRSTLALKLLYFRYIKMLMHYLAVQFPLSHIVSASMMLGRSLHQSLWSGDDWTLWCSEQYSVGVQAKAPLPLTTGRRHEAEVVRHYVRKKPSSKRMVNKKGKARVTPLSVKRIHTLRTAGVRGPG